MKQLPRFRVNPLWSTIQVSSQVRGWCLTAASVVLCSLLLLARFPGMEIAGIGPNWFLIWIVAWSLKRSMLAGALAGVVLGLIQDGLTSPDPTHIWSLMLVGMLTARIQKQRFLQEDFISVAMIVFGMAVLGETIMALQFSFQGQRLLLEIWHYHQLVALSSAILSSLWAPLLYFPLNRLWNSMK